MEDMKGANRFGRLYRVWLSVIYTAQDGDKKETTQDRNKAA